MHHAITVGDVVLLIGVGAAILVPAGIALWLLAAIGKGFTR